MRNRLIEEQERVDFMSDIDREIRNEKINNFLKGEKEIEEEFYKNFYMMYDKK